MPRLTIDEKVIEIAEGGTLLEAAASAGITIPTLCYHKDLSLEGSCRLCMVEVDSMPGQIPACSTLATDGMVVQTKTTELADSRRFLLEMMLQNYGDFDPNEDNEFMRWVRHYDVKHSPNLASKERYEVDSDPNPFIHVDLNKCILCTRCVRVCEEVQGRFVWGVGYRGHDAKVIAGADTTMLEARCESCGACEAYCPTGALTDRFTLGMGTPDKKVSTTCGYCGVGCRIDLNVKDDRIIGVTSSPDAPVNGMSLCVKGRYGWDFVHHHERLTAPLVRSSLLADEPRKRGHDRGEWVEVSWERALGIVAEKLTTIKRENGPDAIGVFASAKCTNEENYLIQKFARQVIGTNNVDHCARLCHSSTVAGLVMSYGSGAMSNSMSDIVEQAQAMFIIGSNTTEQHPVFGAMIRQAVRRRGVKLLVADPRKIDITDYATLHVRHRPGTDVALLNGLMNIILEKGWHDETFIRERSEGFDEFLQTVQKYNPKLVADITGVSVSELNQAAKLIGTNHPMAALWAMGITQHTTGVMNVLCLANLQILLGNVGIPGGGVNPLRGQNNVQGACDMGALPNVLPGYQKVTDAAAIAKFHAAWKAGSVANAGGTVGLTVTEMVGGAGRGDVRALYILGEDPVLTEPDSNHAREALAAAEFVVLQEIFPTETSHYADVLLPGSTFAEKEGTFTNTERRIQLVHPAVSSPGDARGDWHITSALARQILEIENRVPSGPQAAWDYSTTADIMDEIAAVTPQYGGVSYQRLQRGEQLQWPITDFEHAGTPILHVGQFTRGQGKFHAVDYLPSEELPDDEFPLLLTTGRVLHHWHGGEQTRRAAELLEACPESVVEISPDDAARLDVGNDSAIRVVSRRGEMTARAIVTDRVSEGVIFGNFHFAGIENVNNLTISALDPISKIPEYKVCAVSVEPI